MFGFREFAAIFSVDDHDHPSNFQTEFRDVFFFSV